ncbi:ABC transporter family protein [Gossypium australe]|uniref:ABC transporter family protein n=1 Tax=Gossypium australe TaxID=47621 RepID=A0A5B6V9X8_9ROSI|nr:ABC transporter family protein [Gossypium australe]
MALPLCCNAKLHPGYRSSAHYQRLFHFVNRRTLRFSRSPEVSICFKRISHRLAPLKSSSINGFSLETNLDHFEEEHSVENVELRDRIRKWIDFLRSVLPGGSWWSFSDDVEIKFMAKPVTVWRALSRMWQLIAKDRLVIFAAFSTLIVAALSEISIPHYLTATIFSAQSHEIAVFHRNVRHLIMICVTAGICSGLRGCCFGIANMILVKRMRETLYSSLLLQEISFFDGETVGDLTSRLGSDCQQVSRVIGNDLNLIMRNVLQGTGALIYLLILSWPLGLCTLVICSSLAAIMMVYGMYQKKTAKLIQEYAASANEVAQETFSLMRTVRVYGTEKQELKRYNHWLDKLAEVSLRQSAAYGVWNLTFNTLYHATQIIAVLVGGMYILAGHITAEKLTKFILYSEWLIYSTWWVGDNVSSLMQSVGASEKVFQLMDLLPSDQFISEGKNFINFDRQFIAYFSEIYLVEYSTSFDVPCVALRLRDVLLYTVRYVLYIGIWNGTAKAARAYRICKRIFSISFKRNVDCMVLEPDMPLASGGFNFLLVPVLQHINLSVHPGEVVAIVGLSGSGKSTMVNLLLRLYEPTNGQILIDGVPLNELDIKWLRGKIGYVGQEPKLFRMDISSNIKYGCTRNIKQEDVEWAAKLAYAHDFITLLPNGYNTLVDDDLLSGGQKQRIAIARAILRDPTILILDEATSALDAESEHNVKGVLRSVRSDLSSRRTVIVIAHRLSTIQAADRIVVMDGGQIAEMGSHNELLHKNGLYARLTRRQTDAVV